MEEKKLYVIGIGPGAREQMTVRADRILRESQVIIGYTVYVDLVKEFYPQAEFLTTPMRQEKERCEMALKAAQDGRKTAMICSGDSGVYGMAGLVLQMAEAYPDVNVEVIPGVTAALGGGAILGAPLGHDFAVISLSDLLTPMEVIEKRLRAAAEADFNICVSLFPINTVVNISTDVFSSSASVRSCTASPSRPIFCTYPQAVSPLLYSKRIRQARSR